MSDWQPIQTAPKDGKFVLVAVPAADFHGLPFVVMARWDAQFETTWNDHDQMSGHKGAWTDCRYEPTHWMPLPAPPVGPEKTKDNSDSALSLSPLEKP